MQKIASKLPPKITHLIMYNMRHRWIWNWNKLPTYDAKIHYLSAYLYDDSFSMYADKLKVRDYVKDCGLPNILIPLLNVWDNADDIDFCSLPDQYVLKANHGSGSDFIEIVTDNKKANHNQIRMKMKRALNIDFSISCAQYQYKNIERKIICEKLLTNPGHERLDDYKIVCSRGKALSILVCEGRNKGRDYYSLDWKYLEYTKEEYRSGHLIDPPVNLFEMISIAEILSKPFPLARIDLYEVGGKIYFGEITLTPSAGNHIYLSSRRQREIGEMISI